MGSFEGFGLRLRNRRLQLGMTQEEVAKLSGYSSRSCIAKIESRNSDVSRSQLDKLAVALKTTSDYLVGRTDDPDLPESGAQNEPSTLGAGLTKDEQELLNLFNLLTPDRQKVLLAAARGAALLPPESSGE